MEIQQLIAERLRCLSPTQLDVVDDSDAHQDHVGRGTGKHFIVTIKASGLQGIPAIAQHRKIYQLLDDLIPNTIHALEIKVL